MFGDGSLGLSVQCMIVAALAAPAPSAVAGHDSMLLFRVAHMCKFAARALVRGGELWAGWGVMHSAVN